MAALLAEPPPEVIDSIPWRRQVKMRRADGSYLETWHAGEPGQVHVIYHPTGTLKAERSLPKCLTGQNAIDLTQAEVPDALAALDSELALLSGGPGLPPVSEWQPCRVDYCRSMDLEDPALVDLALGRLASMTLPWKGRPTVGNAGTVSWPRGALRPKFYSKGREDGIADHLSLLRFEVGAYGLDTFRTLPGLAPGVALGLDGFRVTLADVLTPTARDLVLGKVLARIGGIPVNADDMATLDVLRELESFFGLRRAAAILGYCLLWDALGVRTAVEADEAHVRAWYRVMADIRRFRAHLADLGRPVEDTENLAAWVATLAA